MGTDAGRPHLLRQQRMKRGWSQKRLADMLDTSKEIVSQWERGVQHPSPYYQEKLSAIFGLTLEELGLLTFSDQEIVPSSSSFVQGISPPVQGIMSLKQGWDDPMDQLRREFLHNTGVLLFPLFFISGQKNAVASDEIVAHGNNVVKACWHLMKGQDIGTAESLLSVYTPTLLNLTFQPSPYQQAIAQIAAQACMIRAIIANHRLNPIAREMYCHEAIQCSRISGDQALHAEALSYLGWTYLYCRPPRPQQSIKTLRAALRELGDTDSLAKSDICLGLADAYALINDESQAKRAIHLAQDCFPSHPEQCTSFLYADISQGTLYRWEAKVYLDLAGHSQQQEYYRHAQNILEQSVRTQARSERSTLETVIYQTTAALGVRDLDAYTSLLKRGALTALQMGSQRRYQEAFDLYQRAPKSWQQESSMRDLTAIFQEQSKQGEVSMSELYRSLLYLFARTI